MKSIVFFFCALGFILTSCHNNKAKPLTITSEDGKTAVTVDANTVAGASADMQKKMEELKKLAPLTTDQLKTMLPGEIMGLKRSSFNASSLMGFASAEATYRDTAEKQLDLSIFDCAGEAGAGIYSLNYWMKMNMQSETDNGYTKTIDFKGQKAVETYEKSNDTYELTYLAADRLLVTIKGEKIGRDAVKQVAESLNLKAN